MDFDDFISSEDYTRTLDDVLAESELPTLGKFFLQSIFENDTIVENFKTDEESREEFF